VTAASSPRPHAGSRSGRGPLPVFRRLFSPSLRYLCRSPLFRSGSVASTRRPKKSLATPAVALGQLGQLATPSRSPRPQDRCGLSSLRIRRVRSVRSDRSPPAPVALAGLDRCGLSSLRITSCSRRRIGSLLPSPVPVALLPDWITCPGRIGLLPSLPRDPPGKSSARLLSPGLFVI
jgi:hypothetical protein